MCACVCAYVCMKERDMGDSCVGMFLQVHTPVCSHTEARNWPWVYLTIAHCLACKTGPILMNMGHTVSTRWGSQWVAAILLSPPFSRQCFAGRSQHSQLLCGRCFSCLHSQSCALGALSPALHLLFLFSYDLPFCCKMWDSGFLLSISVHFYWQFLFPLSYNSCWIFLII